MTQAKVSVIMLEDLLGISSLGIRIIGASYYDGVVVFTLEGTNLPKGFVKIRTIKSVDTKLEPVP